MPLSSSILQKQLLQVSLSTSVGSIFKDLAQRSEPHAWMLLCLFERGYALLSVDDLAQRVAGYRNPFNLLFSMLDVSPSPIVDLEADASTVWQLVSQYGAVLVLRDDRPYAAVSQASLANFPQPEAGLTESAGSEPHKEPDLLSEVAQHLLEQAKTWQPGPITLSDEPTTPVAQTRLEPVPLRTDRYVNTDFARIDTPAQALNRTIALEPDHSYFFRVNIGELERATTLESTPTLLPDRIMQEDVVLTIVLFSEDFQLEHTNGMLGVPRIGFTFVVQPATIPEGFSFHDLSDGNFEARLNDAELVHERLLFRVQTPAVPGRAELRVNIYCQGMLIQSRLVTANIGNLAPLNTAGSTRVSTLEYNLSPSLAPSFLGQLMPHTLSLMVNSDSAGTTHAFRLVAQAGNTLLEHSTTMSAVELTDLIKQARNVLQQVAWGYIGDWDEKTPYRYASPATAQANWRDDIIRLAVQGYRLYDNRIANLGGGNRAVDDLRDKMRVPGVVQLANKVSANDVLPLGMFYDYDLDTQTQQPLTICPQFEASLASGRDLIDEPCFQGNCPHRVGSFTIVCPSGFWGFRHDIGIPWPAPDGPEMAQTINYSETPLIDIAFYQFPELGNHLERLEQLGFQTQRQALRDQAIQMFKSTEPQLVYFYCHGVTIKQNEQTSLPALMIGDASTPGYFDTTSFRPYRIRWPQARPLVLINGCHTTQVSPEQALSFVRTFIEYVEASGVIGTEITVFEPLAQRFAESFFAQFQQGVPFARALRMARLRLLAEYNPLGLVYQPFAYTDLKLVKV